MAAVQSHAVEVQKAAIKIEEESKLRIEALDNAGKQSEANLKDLQERFTEKEAQLADVQRLWPPPHTPTAEAYHERTVMWLFMIGHSLGRIDVSYFLSTFPCISVVSFHRSVLPYKHRKILEMLLNLLEVSCAP